MSFKISQERYNEILAQINNVVSVRPLTKADNDPKIWAEYNSFVEKFLYELGSNEEVMTLLRERAKSAKYFKDIGNEGEDLVSILAKVKPFCTAVTCREGFNFDKDNLQNIQRVSYDNFFSKAALDAANRSSLHLNQKILVADIRSETSGEIVRNVMANNHRRLFFILATLLLLVDADKFSELELFPTKFQLDHLGVMTEKEFVETLNTIDVKEDAKTKIMRTRQSVDADKFNGIEFENQALSFYSGVQKLKPVPRERMESMLSLALESGLLVGALSIDLDQRTVEKTHKAMLAAHSESRHKPCTIQSMTAITAGMVTQILKSSAKQKGDPTEALRSLLEMICGRHVTEKRTLDYRQALLEVKARIKTSDSLAADYTNLFDSFLNNESFLDWVADYE